MIPEIGLYDPQEHEPLCEDPWDEEAARNFVRRIAEEADAAFDLQTWWPLHPEDVYGNENGSYRGLYSGAAGTMWALHALSRTCGMTLKNDYALAIAVCEEAYRRDPWETAEPVPSYFIGTTGIMAARFAITGDDVVLTRLGEDARQNIGNKTREAFWGSPGSAIALLLVREAASDNRFDAVLREIQRELWDNWPVDGEYPLLWLQEMYGKRQRYVGAGHGTFGNLAPFIRASDLLTPELREQLHERIVGLLQTYAIHEGEAANWISMAEPRAGNRLQWCHGAPGIIMALAPYPDDDPRIEDLLRRGAQAIWQAGPLKKGPSFCHGTAGNGYALLRMFARTGNSTWRHRAQRFAMHAMLQAEQWRSRFGVPAFSLWTGELGVALFVDSVLRGDPAVLALDALQLARPA